jgi:triphosphoribosyl-dephospho-CoA synthetase
MTFEDAISWAAELGMPMVREDWRDVLQKCQEAHLEHRTWP